MVYDDSLKISLSPTQRYEYLVNTGFILSDHPIDNRYLQMLLDDNQAGASVVFTGLVRNHNNGRTVEYLVYYGYEQLALNQGVILINKVKQQFDIHQAYAVHRVGKLAIGDMAVWVGVSASHRNAAFDACRWLLDEIKATIPIWKQEFYNDDRGGSLWLANNG